MGVEKSIGDLIGRFGIQEFEQPPEPELNPKPHVRQLRVSHSERDARSCLK